ncbi:low-density lipoprotein receptor-related protein 4 [Exaiptasia diaphana]|uniref:Uncharacterized protein n=1 Tax=Exaiptasia diaphana TaxID=2652724 RepID=A0A913YFX0_EXADI|nr:low-density lipoprotein receptor-related protein 4 [Exaiptasia diaphana]
MFSEVVTGQQGIVALDYDHKTSTVYWTDISTETINSASLTNKNQQYKVIINESLVNPEGLSVDWINRKLYWTNSGSNVIEVADLDGRNRLTLIQAGLEDKLRGIAVYPDTGYMFWTNWGQSPTIEKCGMDGDPSTRTPIVTNHLRFPNGLTIDYTKRRIIWVDAGLDRIESADLNGNQRRVITRYHSRHPFAVSAFKDRVYWSDWQRNGIYMVRRITSSITGPLRTVRRSIGLPMGVRVYSPLLQLRKGMNPCGSNNGGCSHICLLAPRPKTHTCHCPAAATLTLDGKTCKNI